MTLPNPILNQKISFKSLNLIRLDIPQKELFVSGIGVRKSREALIVVWQDQNGVKGYGECSCRPDPYYSDEFIEGAFALIEQFVIPFLKETQTFGELITLLERIRGWNFTRAAVEMAALQVIQQNSGVTAFDVLDMDALDEVPVGISLGIFNDQEHMKRVVADAIDTGYKRLKFKISPKVNTEFFDAIHPMLKAADTYVSFDANGSFGADDLDKIGYFVNTFDSMIEQPFSPNRFDVLLQAKQAFPTIFICFDEEIKSLGDLIKLHLLGVLDEVNLKVGRVGGVMKSLEILAYCAKHNIPCWIGGMFETGIGRTLNLKMASYLPANQVHDLSPSDRYFVEDVIQPGVQMNNGKVNVKSLSHCQIKPELVEKYTTGNTLLTLAATDGA
jgi:O-succinylbenzoate synthase